MSLVVSAVEQDFNLNSSQPICVKLSESSIKPTACTTRSLNILAELANPTEHWQQPLLWWRWAWLVYSSTSNVAKMAATVGKANLDFCINLIVNHSNNQFSARMGRYHFRYRLVTTRYHTWWPRNIALRVIEFPFGSKVYISLNTISHRPCTKRHKT